MTREFQCGYIAVLFMTKHTSLDMRSRRASRREALHNTVTVDNAFSRRVNARTRAPRLTENCYSIALQIEFDVYHVTERIAVRPTIPSGMDGRFYAST